MSIKLIFLLLGFCPHKPKERFKPSPAFDVKQIQTQNPKQVGAYLTKYVTKNKAEFKCQVWNCSKDISALYTDFYTGYEFLEELQQLKGSEIKETPWNITRCTLSLRIKPPCGSRTA